MEDDETLSSRDGGRSGKRPSGGSPPGHSATGFVDLKGTMVGPYKILECLGEGGMGQVYVAEQRTPVRRRVAIKLIKPGMDSREVLARFDAERQALAIMDHPNIARVLDGGMMENGRPYFVMDLVQGFPITEYCDRNQLGVNDRLELFIQVCQGIQHAHQKGVIHRDIKPSNVVVALNHGQPIPKVIDFGIAKAMGGELTKQTYYTLSGQVIGTPQYMSPEQAEAHPMDIDTRSDIYSLGVLLFELLTGRTPIDRAQLAEAGLEETLRLIRDYEPLRPSLAVEKQDSETVSILTANRSLGGNKLSQILRGDLDCLVMKALEKDRNRRYETANALSADVRSFLRNEPITATPPTIGYRVGKFARRHRGPIAAASAVVLALFAGLVVSLWQASRANDEATRANEQAAKAREAEAAALANLDLAEEQRRLAEDQRRSAETQRSRAEEQGRIALNEKEKARKAQELAERSRQQAEDALADAQESRRKAETALADLRSSLQREAEGEIRRSDLERRVLELLAFLRSEEIRQAFQKRHPDGLGIVRSIDDTISEVFPGMRKGSDFLIEDYRLSLKLGQEGLDSLEASLSAASRNLETALALLPHLPEPSDAGEPALIRLLLGKIERMRGNDSGAERYLSDASAAAGKIPPGGNADSLIAAIRLEQVSAAIHLGREESANLLAGAREVILKLSGNDPVAEGLRMRFLALSLAASPESEIPEAMVQEARKTLDGAGADQDPSTDRALAVLELRLALAAHELATARPEPDLDPDTDGGRMLSAESQIPESDLLAFRESLEAVRRLAEDSPDRRVKLSELRCTLAAANALNRAGLVYEALQHFQTVLQLAEELRRLDRDLAEPLAAQFDASLELGALYREAGQHTKRLASLELAHDALYEARNRHLDITRYLGRAPEYFPLMVDAVVHQFFVASSYASTLEENAFYADQVDFFDKPGTDRRAILKSQEDFRKRYGNRLFQVREIEGIEGDESVGFSCKVVVDAFLAAPGGANTIHFGRPDDKMYLEISFAFDPSNRLKITRIRRIDREK